MLTLLALLACNGGTDTDTDVLLDPTPDLELAGSPLTDLARQAVDAAPLWLQDDLATNLGRLDSELQDELGALVVDLEDPYLTDEVAFAIAHTSPEVLAWRRFYPQLFVDNAALVYARDPDLAYVELVDVGEPGVDPDYYTTATYTVGLEDGSVVERTIDPEVYYWYVVHPRLEDELPSYLDAWSSDASVAPGEGLLWREFLWEAAAADCPAGRDCPVLADYLTTEDRLWNSLDGEVDGNAAIGRLIRFVQDAIDFGAGDERPIQPSRIYVVAQGNCGEHADLSCGIARTALIPCQNVGAKANDHTWNEFWDPDQGWVQWEPIGESVGKTTYYVDEDGDYGRTLDGLDNDCDGTADEGLDTSDRDSDGVTVADGDCDDTDASVFPGATEVANARDDDCDGDADEGLAEEADADGDGVTVSAGDCDDLDPDRYPGAPEANDRLDHDCDGVAGTDPTDDDGDTFSEADGDCDDDDPDVFPGATEAANGRDDDCDGLPEGAGELDRDGDGYTVAEGDCDDTQASVYPWADDPRLSTNRLFAMTAFRGDTWSGTDRTETYGTTSTLEFTITDEDDRPVDGAVVAIFGNWGVYGYPDAPAWAAEAVTDLDGRATATVGEANKYWWAVTSPIGDAPGNQQIFRGPTWTEPGEVYSYDTFVNGNMPAPLEATVAEPDGGTALALRASVEVESARIAGDGGYYDLENDYLVGSFSVQVDDGWLDVLVVDDDGLAQIEAGEAVTAAWASLDAPTAELDLELPDGPWHLVLANTDTLSATMVGSVHVEIEDPAADWEDGPAVLDARLRIGPGERRVLTLPQR